MRPMRTVAPICDNFLYGFKGTPSARQAGRPRPSSTAGTRDHRGRARAGAGTMPKPDWVGRHRADSGAGGMPSPAGREPSGLGAATRSAGPRPQAGSSRSNAPTVTATTRTDRAVLLAPGILSPRKDHRQERSLRSRPSDGASRRSGL